MYDDKIAQEICERLMAGECLVDICKDKHLIAYRTVHHWIRQNKEFAKKYLMAKKVQADFYADEIHKIADELPHDLNGLKEKLKNNEKIKTTEVMAYEALSKHLIQTARIRIDVRKWSAAHQRPDKYADKFLQLQKEDLENDDELDMTKYTDQELNDLQNLYYKGRKNQSGESETQSS